MEIAIVLIIILAASTLFISWKYFNLRQQLGMLNEKVQLASDRDQFMKIEPLPGIELQQITDAFNSLIRANTDCRSLLDSLKTKDHSEEILAERIREIENSISRITVISDTGKKITGSLNIQEILDNQFSFISSLIPVSESELLYFSNERTELWVAAKNERAKQMDAKQLKPESSLLLWSSGNGKEALLNHADTDYTRFLPNPVSSIRGFSPRSVLCIPLVHHKKTIGALSLYSDSQDSFSVYNTEIIRSLSSFTAVAIDNSIIYQLLEKNKQLIEEEKAKSDNLLLNILPANIAQELKEYGSSKARLYENVSVLFTDFVSFTSTSEKMSPEELVAELDLCFKQFDSICLKYGLEKIKTIGDAYLAVCGLPDPNPENAHKTTCAAVEMADFMHSRKSNPENKLHSIRLGIHSGPVVAGIVGHTKFAYDIWGDTVNTAARMEQNSLPGKINISEFTHQLIKDQWNTEYRGKINAKNKGEIDMYFVIA